MKITYNITGPARKELVNAIAHLLAVASVYQGPPSFAYNIGGYVVDKNGNLNTPEEAEGHLFTGLLICGICKVAYVYKLAPTTVGGMKGKIPVWMCHGYEKLGRDYCASQRIREDVLSEKTRQVLGLPEGAELTNEYLREKINRIEIPAHYTIRYFLKDGRIETVKWQNPSRSLSWTPEMRKKVSEKNRARQKLASIKGGE